MYHLYVDRERFCPQQIIQSYIGNLTSYYTDKGNESTMVSASVIMFVLAGLFFVLNLFSGVSDVSAILDPRVRLFLSSALSLFLPVMSYLFSEAKNAGYSAPAAAASTAASGSGGGARAADLSLLAGLILAWMLLVELLRKKVDEIRARGYSGAIQRAGRVVWLGNLVFFNIRSAGRKAVFSVLWILCATRVVQRIIYAEVVKRSYAHGRNAWVISSYMAQMLGDGDVEKATAAVNGGGQEALKRCKYIVMGEEKLVMEPAAEGYKLDVKKVGDDSSIVTVGRVWELDDNAELFSSSDEAQQLKQLCLSFALFKLLRRRFEKLPAVTDEEAADCRDVTLRGLYKNDQTTAEALFQVVNDEVNFLSEYYHSVVPVVLASPFFLLVNYFLVLAVVAVLCLMAVILCGDGDVAYAFRSIRADNYTLQFGIGKLAVCLFIEATKQSASAFFSIVDLSITILLFLIYFYEEVWEFFVFVLSNWFVVSLLSSYTANRHCRESALFRFVFHCIIWIRSNLSHARLSFRQVSVLDLRWPSRLPLLSPILAFPSRKEFVPRSLKKSIVDYLVAHDRDSATAYHAPLANGKNALRRHNLSDHLSWACESESVAEVILTWHVATGILEENYRREPASSRKVAIKLSKYCAYLVAFHPELLPDNPEKAERVLEAMKADMRAILGWRGYYLWRQSARVQRIITKCMEATEDGVVRNGAKLARWLEGPGRNGGPETVAVWEVLADVWTEIVVFAAPSSDEERVKAHENVLVQGGEFITVLWALTTHTGVSRPATAAAAAG